MKQFNADHIKNIALLGHASSGKTTLADAVLYISGLTDRIGKTGDGTCVMDFDPEEKKRGSSLATSVYQFESGEYKINMIDAPGLFDFAGGVSEAVTAADTVLTVLSGKSGLSVGAALNFELARRENKACAFFIGKLDSSRAYFYRVISTLTGRYGAVICPVVVPIEEGDSVLGFVDLIKNKAYKYDGTNRTEIPVPENADIENMRTVMIEAAASSDEALMEKYFEGEQLSEAEITSALAKGMADGSVCPVFCGINQTGAAVDIMMELLPQLAPSAAAAEYDIKNDGTDGKLNCDPSGRAAALVFKTVADPFVGKLSFIKVISGEITSDMKLINSRTGNEEKLGKLMWIKAGKQEEAGKVGSGDICCVAKLGGVLTGDTLCAAGHRIEISGVPFPHPQLTLAVRPKNKGEDEKVAAGLAKIGEEDPTMLFYPNNETKELIIAGLGEQHIDVIAAKLKSKFGVEVTLSVPKVAYRETITRKCKVQGRHKKQSGGHGQFGDVWIEFEPCDSDGLVFEEKIFGGAVPKNFFPAVEKGLTESMAKGVLAGYPMVGVKATLTDGSYHPVDSSEMSFKMAAQIAYKEGVPQAHPILLEPIGELAVKVPDENMGDVIGEINKRRGRMLGITPAEDKMQEIAAEVPMAEMSDFSTAMRSIAQGRASFVFTFTRYEEAPPQVVSAIVAENK